MKSSTNIEPTSKLKTVFLIFKCYLRKEINKSKGLKRVSCVN